MKFYYRGVDLDSLMEISTEEFGNLVDARARRRLIKRGLTRKYYALNNKLRKAVSFSFFSKNVHGLCVCWIMFILCVRV